MNFFLKAKEFILKCARVWRITKKPSREEFKTVSKASVLGILVIGLLGFLIAMIVSSFIK